MQACGAYVNNMRTGAKKALFEQKYVSDGLLLEAIKPEIARQASALIEKLNEFEDRIPAEKSQNIVKAINKAQADIQGFIGSSSIARWIKKTLSLSTTRNPLEEGLELVTQLASFFNLMKSMKGLLEKKSKLQDGQKTISDLLGGRGSKNYQSFRKMLVQALKPSTKQISSGGVAGGISKLLHYATGGNDSFFGVAISSMIDEVCDKYNVEDVATLGESKVDVNLQYYKGLAKVSDFFGKTAAAPDPQAAVDKLAAAGEAQAQSGVGDAKGTTQKMGSEVGTKPARGPRSQVRDYASKLPIAEKIFPESLQELANIEKQIDGKPAAEYLKDFIYADRQKWNGFLNSQVQKALASKAALPELKKVIKSAMMDRVKAEKSLAAFLTKTWKEGKEGNPAARAIQVKNAVEAAASKKFAALVVPPGKPQAAPAAQAEGLVQTLKALGLLS